MVAVLVGIESVRRLIHPPVVRGGVLVVVAAIGVLVNLAATQVLAGADRRSLNIEGAFRHIVTDLYAFLGTAVAGVVILLTGFTRADPLASLLVVGLMVAAASGLLRETGRVLLEAAPKGFEPGPIVAGLTAQPGVASVHDVHVWLITSGFPAMSAHVLVDPQADCHDVRLKLERLLAADYGITHTTLQVEHAQPGLLSIRPYGEDGGAQPATSA